VRAGHLWLSSFACCPLAGWPLLAHPSYRRFSFPARTGFAFAAGAVLISSWMTVLAVLGVSWNPIVLVVLASVTSFVLRRLLTAEPEPDRAMPEEPAAGLVEKLALGISGVSMLAALVATASSAATSPDLLLFWGAKAQAFAAARTIDASFLRNPDLAYMHPSYPPLVTNLFAFATQVAGRLPWGAASLTFPLLLAALGLSLPGALRLGAPRRIAWAASALVVSALGFLGNELDVAGNADPWLWTFETLAIALLVSPAVRSGAVQLLAGLLLAGAMTAKVEGLLFALASVALFLLLRRKEIRIGRAIVLLMVPSAVSLGAWFSFEAIRHVFFGYEQYGRFLEVHWDRLPLVLSAISRAFWSAGRALPYLLPLAALLLAPARTRLVWLPIGVSLVLSLFSVFTYLHGDADPSQWIIWSAGRIFSPIPVFLAIGAVCRSGSGTAPSAPNLTGR
jgi:hypothetical protein